MEMVFWKIGLGGTNFAGVWFCNMCHMFWFVTQFSKPEEIQETKV